MARQPGPLGSLSTELLQLMFDELLEYHEIVLFAVTCKMLLAAGVPRLTRAYREEYAPWVNCRLICLGDYAKHQGVLEFPFLTDEEKEELKARVAAKDPKLYEYTSELYSIAESKYTWGRDAIYKARMAISTVYGDREWSNPRRYPKDAVERELISSLLPDYAFGRVDRRSSDGTEVLCNLSKGEYVRADGLGPTSSDADDTEGNDGGSQSPPLTRALVSQICWSDDQSVSMGLTREVAERLVRGPWIGDRFVITTLEDMPDKYRRIDWKDVTERVAAFLVELDAPPVSS